MDAHGRLLPAPNRFPSATNGLGFKPLADYVRSKSLRFGIHIMRGIPRQAVKQNAPVLGTSVHAADIALTNSTCPWNPDMFGVNAATPEGQAYYDSIIQLYASWGVDYIKCDDISRPYDAVQKAEIEALRKAIDKTGRPIVLSLSPGATPLSAGGHVMNHANLWRITDDFWGRWGGCCARCLSGCMPLSRPGTLARCGYVADWHHRIWPEDPFHQGRIIHSHELVEHRPLAAHLWRRPFDRKLPLHGAGLYRLSPEQR